MMTHAELIEAPSPWWFEELFAAYTIPCEMESGKPFELAMVDKILLVHSDGVAVIGSYQHPEAWWVGSPDLFGNVLVKVPADAVKILSADEAEQALAMAEADERLLSYAI